MFDVSHVAKLARLGLADKEKEKFAKDLGAILGFIDKLKEVNIEGVEPTFQVTGLHSVLRPDEEMKRQEKGRKNILANAPETKDGQIKVKTILE